MNPLRKKTKSEGHFKNCRTGLSGHSLQECIDFKWGNVLLGLAPSSKGVWKVLPVGRKRGDTSFSHECGAGGACSVGFKHKVSPQHLQKSCQVESLHTWNVSYHVFYCSHPDFHLQLISKHKSNLYYLGWGSIALNPSGEVWDAALMYSSPETSPWVGKVPCWASKSCWDLSMCTLSDCTSLQVMWRWGSTGSVFGTGTKISAVEELCALTHLFVIMKCSRADKTIRYLKIS